MAHSVEVIEPSLFAHTVAEEIKSLVEGAISRSGRCVIALSGGKTPGAVYRTLGRPPLDTAMPWDKIIFIWGDERWVPHTDEHSNYHLVAENLLHKINSQPKCLPIPTDSKNPATAAKEYSETVRGIFGGDETPKIDIVLLGIGEDGHTASLFPGDKPLQERKALFCAAHSPSGIKDRITMGPVLIENAERVIFLVTGAPKADILAKLLEGNSTFEEHPANIFKTAKGRVTWFVDGPAATKLTTVNS
jgi:6-phosphogluconolactonase